MRKEGMDCKEICELLTAYLDGEVTPKEKAYIETHLLGCPKCRAELEAFSATRENLRGALTAMAEQAALPPRIWERIKNRVEGEGSKFFRWDGFSVASLWRRPGWKTVLLSALGLIAIIGFSLTTVNVQSPEARAASIARSSPEVQAALNGEELEEIKVVTKVVDDEGNVLLALVQTETRALTATVDLETKRVTEIVRVHVPEFTSEDEQRARDIATADPRIQELLARGGIISRISPSRELSTFREGEVKMGATIYIELEGKVWRAHVDLEEGILRGPWPPPSLFSLSSVSMSHLFYRLVALGFIILGILVLVGLGLRNRLSEAIAGVTSVLLGIIGIFWGMYAMSSLPGALVLILGTSAIGLLIGIVDFKRRTGRRKTAIAGVVICSLALVWDIFNIIMAFRAKLEADRLLSPETPSGFSTEWVVPLLLILVGIVVIFLAVKYRKQLLGLFAAGKVRRLATITATAVVIIAAAAIWQFGGFFEVGAPPPAPAPAPAPEPTSPTVEAPPPVITPAAPTEPTPIPAPSLEPPPPMPAPPPPFERSVVPEEARYLPGESIDVTLSLTNTSANQMTLELWPPEIRVTPRLDWNDTLFSTASGTESRVMAPGETVSLDYTWDQKNFAGEQVPPGWYNILFGEITIRYGNSSTSFTPGSRVLIQYPQGATENSFDLNQSQTVNGITVTLERVELTADGSNFYFFFIPPGYTAPPTGHGLPPMPPTMSVMAKAEYSVGGITKYVGTAGFNTKGDGIKLIWGGGPGKLDPVPSDAQELIFIITQLNDWEGLWEFRVPLE